MNELLTGLRDVLSEHMQEEKRGTFIEEFDSLLAKHDTSDVWSEFAIWMLIDPEHGVIRFREPGTHEHHAIQRVAQLFIDDCKDAAEWNAAARDAYDLTPGISGVVYNGLFFAFRAAEPKATYDYAVYAAASASSAFALHAHWAAIAVIAAFHAAAGAAAHDAYEAAFDVADAWNDHVRRMAVKLIELIKQAPEAK